jgi:hypothetical protein
MLNIAFLCCIVAAAGELVVHVRPHLPGASPSPPTWFLSVAEARDYLKTIELPKGGAVVVLHGGHHQPFTLGSDDSGTPDAPITYTSAEGERAVVSGGMPLPGSAFKPWIGHGGVLQANLSALGITAEMLGSMRTAAMSCVGDCQHDKAELYLNGKAMTLARFPNKAADGTWRFLKADKGGKFGRPGLGSGGSWFLMKQGFNASKVSNWVTMDTDHAWLHGYWSYDCKLCMRTSDYFSYHLFWR